MTTTSENTACDTEKKGIDVSKIGKPITGPHDGTRKVTVELDVEVSSGLPTLWLSIGTIDIDGKRYGEFGIPMGGGVVGVYFFPEVGRKETGYGFMFLNFRKGLDAMIDVAREIERERQAQGSEAGRPEGTEPATASGGGPEHEGHGAVGVGESEG